MKFETLQSICIGLCATHMGEQLPSTLIVTGTEVAKFISRLTYKDFREIKKQAKLNKPTEATMKKLIDKLEKECLIGLKDAGYGGWQTGFRDAIDIVRAHNPWHEVSELPPYYQGQFKDSIEVNVMDSKAQIKSVGVYSYENKRWNTDYRPMDVTHWAYLPEAKP